MSRTPTGAELLCRTLHELGVPCVFGLPGTQSVELFEALRTSGMRTVLATHELAAAFMANGFARASGGVGVVITIPGPGFMYALPGLAEARLDSAAVLHVVGQPAATPGRRFRHQELPQEAIAAPLVKRVVSVNHVREMVRGVREAYATALDGEPGPVTLHVATEAFAQLAPGTEGPALPDGDAECPPEYASEPARALDPKASGAAIDVARRLTSARRPLLFLGTGAAGAAVAVRALAERLRAPVLTTPSGRGVLPEDHELSLATDLASGDIEAINELLASADLVLALGCKLSHNGTEGFRLALPEDRLIHVNSDETALGANYAADTLVHARAGAFARALVEHTEGAEPASAWCADEIRSWRQRIGAAEPPPEPRVGGSPGRTAAEFFAGVRGALPRTGILVTDSGLHQELARRHFPVLAPGGILTPTDLQSMGFGLPAAIGARLAAPRRPVVALIGDGGLAISGMELLTLARERLPVVVIVFDDGYLNLIRLQQIRDHGRTHAVRLRNPDMAALAAALGVDYAEAGADIGATLRSALERGRPVLVRVPVGDSGALRSLRAQGVVKAAVRRGLGRRWTERLKRLLGLRR